MTPIELHRLAGATATLRPDWPAASLQTFIERHLQHRPLRDTAIALIACALDPATTTPARVLEPGPWWQMTTTRDVPSAVNTCELHPLAQLRTDNRTGEQTCAGCWVNTHAADTPLPLNRHGVAPQPDTRAQLIAAIRPAHTTHHAPATPGEATG